ncbi:MAG TPA: acyl-CoA thioesterase [Myxococcaceae bacterium]|nr:acyl-CoA thioesterase [Myxococcaceae bacterium]
MLEPKPASASEAVMTQVILPSDANSLHTAFGGRVMEWIDICGGVAAGRHCRHQVVTASMDDLHFHTPIGVGWVVTLRARVLAAFRTSMEVGVTVHAENMFTGAEHLTTSALLTFVALNRDGTKAPVPPLKLETDEERRAFAEAHERRKARLERKKSAATWQAAMTRT